MKRKSIKIQRPVLKPLNTSRDSVDKKGSYQAIIASKELKSPPPTSRSKQSKKETRFPEVKKGGPLIKTSINTLDPLSPRELKMKKIRTNSLTGINYNPGIRPSLETPHTVRSKARQTAAANSSRK